ncbi:hypothetical protein BOTBODRAFT_339252 [Botryobasidium botryosum FD-172 SS1]|uniref:Uncharacterized protein n=1 Tax=Botryobasidium botryosum (strain FD-172 SS1) TaxID=930990 RepID=A0A067MGS9_BOTB1|nr:hypothetical protein BOTBODRAFT_339252 [Botryobasidium botryosum FD-172 SS1]
MGRPDSPTARSSRSANLPRRTITSCYVGFWCQLLPTTCAPLRNSGVDTRDTRHVDFTLHMKGSS